MPASEKPDTPQATRAFAREKWQAEQRRHAQEFSLKERELLLKEQELAFKADEARRSRWWNPLAIAIFGATIAAFSNAYVSRENSNASLEVETFKAERQGSLRLSKPEGTIQMMPPKT
jgi:hypothetical protein